MNSKTQCNLVTWKLIRPHLYVGRVQRSDNHSSYRLYYAEWSVGMEALLEARNLWKCTQVLAEDFMITLGTVTLKEKDEMETKFYKALGTPL